MKKISLLLLIVFCGMLFSQNIGSRGLIHTQSARTFEKGQLEIHTNMNFFTRVTEYLGSEPLPDSATYKGVNYWLVASNLAITYGIIDNLDITIAPRLYQDTHYKNEYNIPGDIFLTLKAGSFAFAQRHMYGAVLLSTRLATGEEHNYPFAEYASGSVEYGFKGALSYFMDPYLPDRSLNMHLNLGWWNHNEAGSVIYKDEIREFKATTNSSELQYAFGLSYPTAMFNFNLEANGISFLTEPDEQVYSRENWTYISPSIKYKPTSWFSFDLGMDIRVSSDDNTTKDVPDRTNKDYDLPNYAPWKVHMGLNLRVLPLAASPKTAAEVERDEFQKRVDFFQKIVEDREHSEDVQEELKKLIEEREEAEKELEELKRILEEEG